MKIHLASFLFILSLHFAVGQNLSAYVDYKNYFYVYNDGPDVNLEYQPIKSYKVGGNSIAYVNGTDNFKVFFNGITYDLLDVPPSDYYATRDLVVYFKNKILTVFDNGKKNSISMYTDNYMVGDSIVAVFDQNSSTLRVYYNHDVQELEFMQNQTAFKDFKTGSNILAYSSFNGHFKIFYHSKIFDVENTAPTNYQAGGSIVAYVDEYTRSFKIFYQGNTYTLEDIQPKSYIVADNTVAYVDNNGIFKIFYQGKIFRASSFEPAFYNAKDRVIVYYDNNFFKAFYKENVTQLESYVPENYQIDFDHVAYIDRSGYLKALYNGELQQISKEKTNSFELNGNVLKFNSGLSDILFFCNGKIIYH